MMVIDVNSYCGTGSNGDHMFMHQKDVSLVEPSWVLKTLGINWKVIFGDLAKNISGP